MIYSHHHVGGVSASGHNKSTSIKIGSSRVFLLFLFVSLCLF
jgi:hypothetical protein